MASKTGPHATHRPPAGTYEVRTRTRASLIAGFLALLLLVALVLAPLYVGRGLIRDLFTVLTLLTLAQLWNLLAGYAGLVSVGQQAFVGLGGYALFAGAILLGLDPYSSILLAGVVAALLAIPSAFVVFRLQGAYFAIGTWVVAEVFRLLLAQWKALGGGTGTSLPPDIARGLPGAELVQEILGVRGGAARDIIAYWLALVLAVAVIGGIYAFLRSKRGLGLSAIRDNLRAAQSVGVDAYRLRLVTYVVVAFGTGLAVALIFLQTARISPDAAFSVLDWTAYVIFIVVIGGIGTIEGPIVGVLVFWGLQESLGDYGTWYLITLGAIAILVMLFAPRGLWGLVSERFDLQLFPVRRRLVRTGTEPDKREDGNG